MKRKDLSAAVLSVAPDCLAPFHEDVLDVIERLHLDDLQERVDALEAGRLRLLAQIDRHAEELRAARSAPQPVSADAIANVLTSIDGRLRLLSNVLLKESDFTRKAAPSFWRRWFPGLVPAKRLS
jgi:hypothetical protein